MFLNQTTAAEIIKRITPVIDFDLNMIDNKGWILASTNPQRIDTYHEGAHLLIERSLEELIIDEDWKYDGCRQGVNLPIHFATEIIGVIGITGNPEEVIKYGRIIQKMTEILIREYVDLTQENTAERRRYLFLDSFLNGNLSVSLFELETWLKDHGLTLKASFTAAILAYTQPSCHFVSREISAASQDMVKRYIKSNLSGPSLLPIYGDEFFIVLSNHSPRHLAALFQTIAESVASLYELPLLGCIGDQYQSYLDIPKSFHEALTLFHYLDHQQQGVFFHDTISLEFTLNQLPVSHKQTLHRNVFKHCTPTEINAFTSFILDYFACSGSLTTLAGKYFIHKNTVQYKIQRIEKKTGLNPRVMRDLFILYLAASYHH